MGKFVTTAVALVVAGVAAGVLEAPAVLAGAFPAPSNGRIAFTVMTAATGGPQPDIATVKPDGTGFVNLTPSDQLWGASPDWSADNTKVAFIGFTEDEPNGAVYTMYADGSTVVVHTNAAEFDRPTAPSWSPDGSKIVFSSTSASGGIGLWVLTVSNGAAAPLTDAAPNRIAKSPAWSPDGTRIAYNFVNGDDGEGNGIRRVNADGAGDQFVSAIASPDTTVSWSPDGARLVLDDANGNISTVKPDGTGEQIVLAANGIQPAWSPDGLRVTYKNVGDDPPSIHTINLDGSGDTKVFQAAAPHASGEPAWGGRDAVASPTSNATSTTTTTTATAGTPGAATSPTTRPTPLPSAPPALLPRTGRYAASWLWGGVALASLGLGLVAASRRRHV